MNYSLKTHQGKRKDNQDYAGVFLNQSNILLAILCDGLGGHQAGDIASEMAVSQIGNSWENTDFSSRDTFLIQNWLKEKINRENTRIFEAAETYSDLEGMGTTLVASVILNDTALFANIGDSRAYIYNEGTVELVTEDHSFVSELQRKGGLTDSEAMTHYNKNALTRSLGVRGDVEVDFFKKIIRPVEMILLNSDGFSNVVSEEEMIKIFEQEKTAIDEKTDQLIEASINNEASDNVTVVLIDVSTNSNVRVGENE